MTRRSPDLAGRRHALRMLGLSPLAIALVAGTGRAQEESSQAEAKMSKEEAQYQSSPKDDHTCAGCTHFVEGGTCRLVEGEIAPNGWCKLWAAA